MNLLKLVASTVVNMVKQTIFLPRTFAQILEKNRHRTVLNDQEAERLDRIRNPSKYLGK